MPFGVGTDGDIGYIVAMSDAYTFWGLEKTVKLLEEIKHSEAGEFRKELELYRGDLAIAIKGLSHPDGFIERKIITNDTGANFYAGFENVCSSAQLAYAGVIDPESEIFQRFISYFEQNRAFEYFMGNIDKNITYTGIAERDWQYIYLTTGQWKKAFAANRANLQYGMTHDAYQVQERLARNNPAFTPWQPNGSGNGRILEMMLNSIYFETEDGATLLGGIPFTWLKKNKTTSLQNLYTVTGRINIHITAVSRNKCAVSVVSDSKNVIPSNIRFPEYLNAMSKSKSVKSKGNGLFILTEPVENVVFEISAD
jgi:hypothetical protein